MTLARYRKLIVALVGVVAQAVNLGLLHGTAESWATIVLAAATALGVYTAPNT